MDKATIQKLLEEYQIKEALQEVQTKPEVEIEKETALKWASRSIASFLMYHQTQQLHWLLTAEVYYNEAVEHAAAVKDNGRTVAKIQQDMDTVRPDEGKAQSATSLSPMGKMPNNFSTPKGFKKKDMNFGPLGPTGKRFFSKDK